VFLSVSTLSVSSVYVVVRLLFWRIKIYTVIQFLCSRHISGNWVTTGCVTGVWEYITETRDMVHNLESRLQSSKDNVEQIQKIMAMWSKTPLFERSENKNSSLLNLSDRDDRTKKRYEEIAKEGAKIHELLQVTLHRPPI